MPYTHYATNCKTHINMHRYKTPCGMRDFSREDVCIRKYIFNKVRPLFELRGGSEIDTPVAELMSTIQGIYGEEFNKLVYKVGEDTSEPLLLRYDLTVPFARYINSNGLVEFRRFQIGKVYRKDHPQIDKGRFREFYQCDFDILGTDNNLMIFDTEILDLLFECLMTLLGDTFKIIVNHRQIVYKILELSGITEEKYNEVCSTLDKMDKKSWDDIVSELINIRKLDNTVIKQLTDIKTNLLSFTGTNSQLLEYMKISGYIYDSTYDELLLLFDNLKKLGIENNFTFNPFLIRGLDYYTGIIYEAVYNCTDIMPSSIASGGRYDKMMGKIGTRGDIPAIGMSLGIERIVVILETTEPTLKHSFALQPFVYIATIGQNMIQHAIILCTLLRRNGIYATMSNKKNPKMGFHFKEVFSNGAKYMVILGENEIKNSTIILKDIEKNQQEELDREKFILLMITLNDN